MELRPPRDEDWERVQEQNNRLLPRRAFLADELLSFLAPIEHGYLLAWDGDTLLGAGGAFLEAARPHPRVRIVVDTPHRRRGVGGALFAGLSQWARDRGHEVFDAWIDDDQPEAIAFARRRGFEQVSHDAGLELDLRDYEPPPVEPPPGVEIVRWAERPELVHGLYAVACEAYVDIPGEEDVPMQPFERWLADDMQGSGDSPEWTFVALAGDEVVGYSKFSLTKAMPTAATHDLTGVRRAWRGRGVARALKAAQIRWAKENGYELLMTSNEDRNAPIRKLNADFGYRPAPGRGTYRGPVAVRLG